MARDRHDRTYSRLTWGAYQARDPVKYCGTFTPISKRDELGISGLVPPVFLPLELDVERCMKQLRSKSSEIEKYTYLANIQDVSERLFYAMLVKHTAEIMPIIYTPTVGLACQNFSEIYRGTLRGMYFSLRDAGSIRKMLDNWPTNTVTTIVVTDGERILGLGDLGINGMGIPIGKLALYTACAGIDPAQTLPVVLDMGTNNESLLNDPYYLGLRQHRERGPAYDALVTEFFQAAQDKFGPDVLIQFEDFANMNAFRLLDQWKNKACTFNDDIQGTASVCVAGLIASHKLTGKTMADHTFLFAGAGEAATGIAELIALTISQDGSFSLEEARKKVFLVDSHGLVTASRKATLQHHKLYYAHAVDHECHTLLEAVHMIQPTALIGVSAVPNFFTKEICNLMAEINSKPIIFALSNPTSQAECTAEQAYTWTNGRAIFASGSPFAPVTLSADSSSTNTTEQQQYFVPGQGNNAYIFPGVGLGRLAAGSTRITQQDMLLAAHTLAAQVSAEQLAVGCLYPPLRDIRAVSVQIAVAVARQAHATGVATNERPDDMEAHIKSLMYDPFEDPFSLPKH